MKGIIFAGHGLKKRLKVSMKNAENGMSATAFSHYVDATERFGIVEFDQMVERFQLKKSL